jgi:hypothetical protein
MVIAQFSLNEEWQMTKDHPFNSGSGENSLNVGAAVLSGDLTPSQTVVAARRAAPTFSWSVAPLHRHERLPWNC